MNYTPEEKDHLKQRLMDAIMDRPGPPEITVTSWNGLVENVENIPRGQSVITRDIDEGAEDDKPLIVQRWYFDGTSETIFEGEIENEKLKPVERSRII